MIFTSDLMRLRESLLTVTTVEWLLLALGLILGVILWGMFKRKVVRKLVRRLADRGVRENRIALVEGAIGLSIMASNTALIYLCELCWNFFLFSFAVAGLLIGAWILIPAD